MGQRYCLLTLSGSSCFPLFLLPVSFPFLSSSSSDIKSSSPSSSWARLSVFFSRLLLMFLKCFLFMCENKLFLNFFPGVRVTVGGLRVSVPHVTLVMGSRDVSRDRSDTSQAALFVNREWTEPGSSGRRTRRTRPCTASTWEKRV